MTSNHYDTLNLSPHASQAEIKQAYRRLVKLFHPDSNRKTTDAEQIVRINAAYEVLGDVANRRSYDQHLRIGVADRPRPDVARAFPVGNNRLSWIGPFGHEILVGKPKRLQDLILIRKLLRL